MATAMINEDQRRSERPYAEYLDHDSSIHGFGILQ
jgi:hypothetical protein